MNERLRKQAEFLLEIDKMKRIYRQTHIPVSYTHLEAL